MAHYSFVASSGQKMDVCAQFMSDSVTHWTIAQQGLLSVGLS